MPYKDTNSEAAVLSKSKADKKYISKNREQWNIYQNEYKKRNKKKYSELPESVLINKRKWSVRYHKNHAEEMNLILREQTERLDDSYIIKQLYKEGVPIRISKMYPQVIEAKRITLLLKRKIKNK